MRLYDAGKRPGGEPKRTEKQPNAVTKANADRARWSQVHTDSVKKNGADGRAGV